MTSDPAASDHDAVTVPGPLPATWQQLAGGHSDCEATLHHGRRAGADDETALLAAAPPSEHAREWSSSVRRLPPTSAAEGSGAAATLRTGRRARSELAATVTGACRYQIRELLGSGGMGDVLLAQQVELGREVAVKVLREGRDRPGVADAFRAESLVTAWLEHPNVVPVHDAGDDFLVMKRVRGHTLLELLARDGRGPDRLPGLVEILLKVCDALAFAHARGVIHRDLKPANIMVGAYGEVLVMDWGLAAAVWPAPDGVVRARPLDARTVCSGTPAYLPPEVARADLAAIGLASDVFQLGGLLYHLLTGRAPYRADGLSRHLALAHDNAWPAVIELEPGAAPALVAVQARAMAGDPSARGSVADFADALRTWLRSSGVDAEAQRCRGEADSLRLQGHGAGDPQRSYQCYAAALSAADRALGLVPGFREAQDCRAAVQIAWARRALAADDLVLAGAVLATGGAAPLNAARAEVAAAWKERAAASHRARRLRLGSAALIAALAIAWLTFLAVRQGENRAAELARRGEAAELVRLADAAPRPPAGRADPGSVGTGASGRASQPGPGADGSAEIGLWFQSRLVRAEQALGLDPASIEARYLLRDTAADYARWAVDHQAPELAAAQLATARAHELDPQQVKTLEHDIGELRLTGERARAAERARREQRLAELAAETEAAPVNSAWHEQAAAEISQWYSDGDDPATREATIRQLAGLATSPSWAMRILLCRVAVTRSDLVAARTLVPLLKDPAREVAIEAARAAARRRDGEARWPLIELLRRRTSEALALARGMERALIFDFVRPGLAERATELVREIAETAPDSGQSRRLADLIAIYRLFPDDGGAAEALIRRLGDPQPFLDYLVERARRRRDAAAVEQLIPLLLARGQRSDVVIAARARASVAIATGGDLAGVRDELQRQLAATRSPELLPWLAAASADSDLVQARGLAERAAEAARSNQIAHPADFAVLVPLLRRCSRPDEALHMAHLHLRRDPLDFDANRLLAETLLAIGRASECLDQTLRMGELHPRHHAVFALRARAYSRLGQHARALAAAEQALVVMPDDADRAEVLAAHAEVLEGAGQQQHALSRWLRAELERGDAFDTESVLRALLLALRLDRDGSALWLSERLHRRANANTAGTRFHIRGLLACGGGALVIDALAVASSRPGVRVLFDEVLFAIPASRRGGWPGSPARRRAHDCLAQALEGLAAPVARAAALARAGALVDDAAAIAPDDAAVTAVRALVAAVAAGQAVPAATALRDLAATTIDGGSGLTTWRRSVLPTWLAATAAGRVALPLPSDPGRFPPRLLADLHLSATDLARLRGLWRAQLDRLVPSGMSPEEWTAGIATEGFSSALDRLEAATPSDPAVTLADLVKRLAQGDPDWDWPPRERIERGQRGQRGQAPVGNDNGAVISK